MDPYRNEQFVSLIVGEALALISRDCTKLQEILRTMAKTSRQGAEQTNPKRTKEQFEKLADLCKQGEDRLADLREHVPTLNSSPPHRQYHATLAERYKEVSMR